MQPDKRGHRWSMLAIDNDSCEVDNRCHIFSRGQVGLDGGQAGPAEPAAMVALLRRTARGLTAKATRSPGRLPGVEPPIWGIESAYRLPSIPSAGAARPDAARFSAR